MARPNVPKFGDWKNEDNVPYTVYFEKARENRGGKMINPNDPRENPDMFANIASPAPPSGHRAQQEEPIGRGKASHLHRVSREDSEFRQFADSPARIYKGGPGGANESTHRGTGSGRHPMPRVGSEHSIERSPLHLNNQVRPTGRGNGSPAWEGKRPNEMIQGTPGRSRMDPNSRSRGDAARDRDVAIPRFGDWDVKNPQSADNYTYIFNKNSRNAGVSGTNSAPSNNTNLKQNADHDVKFSRRSCFSWWKK